MSGLGVNVGIRDPVESVGSQFDGTVSENFAGVGTRLEVGLLKLFALLLGTGRARGLWRGELRIVFGHSDRRKSSVNHLSRWRVV